MSTHTLSGIITKVTEVQNLLSLEGIKKASRSSTSFKGLQDSTLRQLMAIVVGIERSLTARNLTGADLAIRSRRAYQWLKYLSDPDNLLSHLDVLQRFNLILRNTRRKPGLKISFSLYHIGSLYKLHQQGGQVIITAQESFLRAPDRILQALVGIALDPSGKNDRTLLRDYAFSKEYRQVRKELEYLGIPQGSFAAGKIHNLEESFLRVNQTYFQGKIAQPRLVWNRMQTYRKFGHYQWDTDTVMVSRSLDQARVPETVVDYVVYHELLHKIIGAKQANQNRIVHTREFREAEGQFIQIDKARQFLNRIAKKRARNI